MASCIALSHNLKFSLAAINYTLLKVCAGLQELDRYAIRVKRPCIETWISKMVENYGSNRPGTKTIYIRSKIGLSVICHT